MPLKAGNMFPYVGHRSIDPNELETRISTEEGVCWLDFLVDDDFSEEKQDQLERIQELLDDLPPMEADYVDLYYYRKKKQTDIASLFNVSQPTVCYRLQRAAARIQFLLSLPQTTDEEVEETMRKFLTDDIDVKIMVMMRKTTCQSEVAKRLNVSQGLVRHRFIRAIRCMYNVKMYHEGFRYMVLVAKDDSRTYWKTLKEAKQSIDWDAHDEACRKALTDDDVPCPPKVSRLPKLDPKIGEFYEIYNMISSNLNILRDVRRKTPEQDVQLVVW